MSGEVNDRAFVQDLLIADIEERKEFGIRKHGRALQSGNGRDMLQDAYEEAIDLAIYLRGMKDEDHHLELELLQVRKERDWLVREVQEIAAPMLLTSTGTAASALHNLGEYVAHLEAIIRDARDLISTECPTHSEYETDAACDHCRFLINVRKVLL